MKTMLEKAPTDALLVWAGPDVQVLDVSPKAEILGFDKRYESADDAISAALSLPRLLIDGRSSGTSSRDWSVFLSTIEKLHVVRNEMATVASSWFQAIATENKFKNEVPEAQFTQIHLKDDRTLKNLVIKAFEDTLLSRRDAIRDLGYDPDQVIENLLREKEEGLNDLIDPPRLSFTVDRKGDTQKSPEPGRPGDDERLKTDQERPEASLDTDAWAEALVVSYLPIAQQLNEIEPQARMAVFREAFSNLQKISETLLAMSFDMDRGKESQPQNLWRMRLIAWHQMYFMRFRDQLWAMIADADDVDRPELLEKQLGRIRLYATEGQKKARLAAQLERRSGEGYVGGVWRTVDDCCDECRSRDGRWFSFEDLFEGWPAHVNCIDEIEFTKEIQ